MTKLSKAAAGYLTSEQIGTTGGIGTKCGKCRDFITSTSECLIVDDPKVSAERGTCTQYLTGTPYTRAKPLRLISKKAVGYIEGPEVPTYCGKCEYYEETGRYHGTCEKVEGLVDYGGCSNIYEFKK